MRSKWFGLGGVVATIVCVLTCGVARAQSSGSFPEPAQPPAAAPPAPPPTYAPAAPVYTPPATTPAPAPAPVVTAPAPYAPPANPQLPPYQPALPSGLENLPPLLPYQKGLPIPPGYRVVERPASGLMIGGGVTFLAAYLAGLGLAMTQSFSNGSGYTAIPVAGPWAAIGGRTFKCKTSVAINTNENDVQKAINRCVGNAFDEVTTVVFLTADGLVQATGAVIFFVGLGSGYQQLVRKDLPKTAVTVLPEGGMALSVSGNF